MARALAVLALLAAVLPTAVVTAPGLRLSFSAPVLASRSDPKPELSAKSLLAGPDAVYHNEGMPPIRSGSLRPFGAVQLDDGTIVQASITCFEGDHIPVWSHADVPSSTVAHRSTDGGKHWNFSATIGAAKDFPWSGEGFNEGGLALAADGKTIVTASRTGAGDYSPAAACLGYFDYHTSRSTDSGLSWSFPEPIVGAGSCSPNLLNIGNSLILGGGRMCGNSTTDVFLWLDEAGMGDPKAFVPYSISYWYNELQKNVSAPRFDDLINTTCRDEDNGMITVKALTNTTGSVTFDLDINHKDLYYTMNFSLLPSAGVSSSSRSSGGEQQGQLEEGSQGRGAGAAALGGPGGPGSVPLGRDKADCISWFGQAVVPTTSNSSTKTSLIAAPAPHLWSHQGSDDDTAGGGTDDVMQIENSSSYESDADQQGDERSPIKLSTGQTQVAVPTPIPVIERVCANWTTKSRHGTVTSCDNLTSFPTDGAFAPIILIGSNFSWNTDRRRNAAPASSGEGGGGAPTCRIDPYHGGSIFIAKGQNVNASDTTLNYVTFPATVHNDTHASCTPPPVLANGPGLLRLSVDNATWLGISGEAGFPVEYYSLVDLAVGTRPYINTDLGHLLVRTDCLATGETIGHDLCQTSVSINATLQSVGKTWTWNGINQGDRALPFNMSSLPANVHNDMDVTIVFGGRGGLATGDYVIHRLVRFARVTTTSSKAAAQAVQVDAWTKTLTIGGSPFVGSGFYFGSYSPSDLLQLAAELPSLVKRGVNMGVMLTLPGSNSSVQRVFFDAAERSGFKVIWPLFITTSLDANQTQQVQALREEQSLLGYYIADDGCSKAHGWISRLAQGYIDLKRVDPLHATFGSVNCDSPWLFSDTPSFLPPNASAAKAVVLPRLTQPRTQLSFDVPLLENYGSNLSGQMDTGRWSGGPKRDGDFRHGIPFTPIGNCLSPSQMPPSTFGAGLWMGVVLAEVYYSAGWAAVPSVNMSDWDSAVQNYSTALQKFEPHRLARFGNTRLSVALSPPETVSSLRARAWYDADENAAYVVIVNAAAGNNASGGSGESTSANFTATVKQLFNPRMVYRQVNGSVGAGEAAVLRVPGCRENYRPVATCTEGAPGCTWENDLIDPGCAI